MHKRSRMPRAYTMQRDACSYYRGKFFLFLNELYHLVYCIFVFLSLFSCNITGQINGHREVNIFAIRYTIFFLFELTLHTFNLSVLLLNISFRWRVAVWLQGGGCYRTIVDTRSLYQKSVAQCEYQKLKFIKL